MRKPAVAAPDGKMSAANDDIMRTMDMAVSATGLFKKVPHVVAPDTRKCPRFGDILNTGNKNASGTAVVTGNLSLVGYCLDYLICNLPAMVAVSAKFCENKLVAHENYWMLSRFINLLHLTIKPENQDRLKGNHTRNNEVSMLREYFTIMIFWFWLFLIFALNEAPNHKNTT
jgi:hypothetical protein